MLLLLEAQQRASGERRKWPWKWRETRARGRGRASQRQRKKWLGEQRAAAGTGLEAEAMLARRKEQQQQQQRKMERGCLWKKKAVLQLLVQLPMLLQLLPVGFPKALEAGDALPLQLRPRNDRTDGERERGRL